MSRSPADLQKSKYAWVQCFAKMDTNQNGLLELDELKTALEQPDLAMHLSPSDSPSFVCLEEELRTGVREGVGLEEFQDLMTDLFQNYYSKFFQSLALHRNLSAVAVRHILGIAPESVLEGEAKSLHPFESLKQMSKDDLMRISRTILLEAVPQAAEEMARAFTAASEYEGQQAEGKGKYFDMVLGDVGLFEKGLEKLIGMPSDLKNPHLAVEAEHSSTEIFKAVNNGEERECSPAAEWKRVLPDGFGGEMNTYNYAGTINLCPDGKSFEEHEYAVTARLSKLEIVCLRLYTGPMYKLYNGKMRALLSTINKLLGEGNTLEDAARKAFELSGNDFVTTIHVIVSGLLKLRVICVLPPNKKVYRGFSGLDVPECFKMQTKLGNRGGVEFGFLSTSSDKNAALGYIDTTRGMPQLYEMDVGQIDRGASLEWLSYFQGEKEILLPPLSSLEAAGDAQFEDIEVFEDGPEEQAVDGTPTKTPRLRKTVKIMTWPVRVNVNLKGKTLEEHQEVRKVLHGQMADNALSELRILLESKASTKLPEDVRSAVTRQCTEVVQEHRGRVPDWFNDDVNYNRAIGDVLDIIPYASILATIAGLNMVSSDSLVTLQFQDVLSSKKGNATSKISKQVGQLLCRNASLFKDHIEEHNEKGTTSLIEALSNGRKEHAWLLLQAGAFVGGFDRKGRSTAHLACKYAYPEVLQLLIEGGAELSRTTPNGRTPGWVCASKGHGECLRLLAQNEADLSTPDNDNQTPAYVAAAGGHWVCLRAIAEKKIDLACVDSKGRTPAWIAAANGRKECLQVLHEFEADLSRSDEQGCTPAYAACQQGHDECLKFLADTRPDDLSITDVHGISSAFHAAIAEHDKCLSILEQNDSINALDALGQTALDALEVRLGGLDGDDDTGKKYARAAKRLKAFGGRTGAQMRRDAKKNISAVEEPRMLEHAIVGSVRRWIGKTGSCCFDADSREVSTFEFATITIPDCMVPWGEKAYYEIEVVRSSRWGIMGWGSLALQRHTETKSSGVGLSHGSWGVSGWSTKGFKCSGGVKSQCGIAWKAGDIVGLAVDLSGTGSIMVSVNGKDEMPCGVIFSDLSHAGVIEGVFPACSLMPEFKCKIHVEAFSFKFAPPDDTFKPVAKFAGFDWELSLEKRNTKAWSGRLASAVPKDRPQAPVEGRQAEAESSSSDSD